MAVMIIVLILFLNFCGLHAQISPNISLGSSFTAGSDASLRSLSGDFAFGFYPLQNGLYLVGIWFDRIPEKTLVWSANRNHPAEKGSSIQLTNAGALVLTYGNGSTLQIYNGTAASLGTMKNDGNFVLRENSSRVLWQSFTSSTDTLLRGQALVKGQKLYSKAKGSSNYSTGNFMLEMQSDGNLVLSAYHFSDPGYWTTQTFADNVSLVFDKSASLYLVNGTMDEIFPITKNISSQVEDYYHRATVEYHGNFQQYIYHIRNGSGWKRVWRVNNDTCFANSICGINGMCTSSDNETVTCSCLPGYLPLDPSDVSEGCYLENVLNYCAVSSMRNFSMKVIEDADFPSGSYDGDLGQVTNVSVEGCKKALMDDCYTLAASWVDSKCLKKRMPLLNARKSVSTKGRVAFIKVANKKKSEEPSLATKRKNFDTRVLLEIGLMISASLAFLFGLFALYYHLLKRKQSPNAKTIGINFREFTFQELREATNGFSKVLGRGASGRVYSGSLTLEDAKIDIAVKELTKATEKSEKEFRTELKVIGRTHQRNLVRLLGFCVENDQPLLVYELMPNGTLSHFLFKEGERPTWLQRSEMALEVASGLHYLHEECEAQIIHCDIKPDNVLLDVNYTAKIADFGLSKLLNKQQTRTDTNARGTYGYMAPEWLKVAPITAKVDVYSFGVMLLEIICARRHIERSRVEEESDKDDLLLSNWVLSCVISGKLEMVVGHEPEVLSDFKRFERMALVGLWCINPDPILRPSMKKVTQMLEGTMEVGIPPQVYDYVSNN
ncbi:G-type lectin S-receptor-like serine/threonine-protein kinase LECRK4 [Quercus lobata]|uniref:Receptor-like serine/threonine-protein kinase n=1 Tax=Quercus lobata TaxID=97700 RepID=A0A7N2LWW5_QUELO|nr:G-type lectin S-receptor-like serine/threonine-protein kinase LECRK4 [Quercus lobata]XP_030975655.1 G-type lectin S-receptor-like serine/threonine-protein kinase LECRK4 [Quercus lobata]